MICEVRTPGRMTNQCRSTRMNLRLSTIAQPVWNGWNRIRIMDLETSCSIPATHVSWHGWIMASWQKSPALPVHGRIKNQRDIRRARPCAINFRRRPNADNSTCLGKRLRSRRPSNEAGRIRQAGIQLPNDFDPDYWRQRFPHLCFNFIRHSGAF